MKNMNNIGTAINNRDLYKSMLQASRLSMKKPASVSQEAERSLLNKILGTPEQSSDINYVNSTASYLS